MTQVGAPVQGEVLASRYRLDELVQTDPSVGHALWRGTDGLLNRAVGIELRIPGGPAAAEMLNNAVTAGRIVHPCVVGVYDAVDEGGRAFVVREWVEGISLRDAVREGPLEPGRAAAIARTAADALASIHASGYTHGNLQPGTVLLGADDEITLTDLRLDPTWTQQMDVRAIGGLLYAALTSHWPHELPPYATGLPDAVHVDGRLLSPRQVRAGIPGYLDALTMDLLDPTVPAPPAVELAAELRRYDVADPDLGPLTAITPEPAARRSPWRRISVLGTGVACIVAAGLVAAAILVPDSGGRGFPNSDDPTRSTARPKPSTVAFAPAGVKVLDPPGGDLAEADGTESNATDDNPATEWRTQEYNSPEFGNIARKPGMGLVVDLGAPKDVRSVTVLLSQPGATVELRAGNDAPGRNPEVYETVGEPKADAGQSVTFTAPSTVNARYVMVWITVLPPYKGKYGIGVQEIKVSG